MSFATGQRVHFKGDPEKEVYVVDFAWTDGTVDLATSNAGHETLGLWGGIPGRLLEPVSTPEGVDR